MDYKILERIETETHLITKVEFSYPDDTVTTVEIHHFQPPNEESILESINNRIISEIRNWELAKNPVVPDPVVPDPIIPEPVNEDEAARLADLATNGRQYVLENQYILLCDALRQSLGQEPTQTPVTEEDFPIMLLTLKRTNREVYETIRDAFALVTGKLVTYNLKWMDTVCWHGDPELADASNAIVGLIS